MTAGPGRQVAAGAGALAALVVLVAGAASGALGGILGAPGANVAPSGTALSAIPADYLALYQQAAATCPGLPWAVLAAIGTVESANGQSTLPGVHSGVNFAGVAEGPMQFEPATFVRYDQPIPPGGADPPSPYDPIDAIYAAARDLCANGARDGANMPSAVYAYNHDLAYVAKVLTLAASYSHEEQGTPGPAAAVAVAYVEAQIGTPYRWGAEGPGVAFDCSGLVQAAYAAAGIALPRTAQAQHDAVRLLSPNSPLEAGDLVFFGSSPTQVTHVGIYVGTLKSAPVMVDAPHRGAGVRVEPIDWPDYLGGGRVV
jgi:cell wall-associated NlpC family hydrolase